MATGTTRKVNETARKVGEKMGLPAGWDVVERMAGTDAARLLKKELMGEPVPCLPLDFRNLCMWLGTLCVKFVRRLCPVAFICQQLHLDTVRRTRRRN